jgi:hypothetical protein
LTHDKDELTRDEIRLKREEIHRNPADYVAKYARPRTERPSPQLKEERVTIRFAEGDLADVDAMCDQMGIGRSTFVRMAVKQYVYECKRNDVRNPSVRREVAATADS